MTENCHSCKCGCGSSSMDYEASHNTPTLTYTRAPARALQHSRSQRWSSTVSFLCLSVCPSLSVFARVHTLGRLEVSGHHAATEACQGTSWREARINHSHNQPSQLSGEDRGTLWGTRSNIQPPSATFSHLQPPKVDVGVPEPQEPWALRMKCCSWILSSNLELCHY